MSDDKKYSYKTQLILKLKTDWLVMFMKMNEMKIHFLIRSHDPLLQLIWFIGIKKAPNK
jgi:hypothetical protein